MLISAIIILTSLLLLGTPQQATAAQRKPSKNFFSSRYFQKRIIVTPPPTSSPSPTPTATPEPSVASVPTAVSTRELVTNFLIAEINKYRDSKGLSAVTVDEHTCAFAKVRAEEISTQFDHTGFRNRIENKTLPYPTYSEVTENIAMTSNYKEVVNLWINSSGHAENMRKETPFVCVKQSGNYFVYEGWKP